MNCIHKNVDKNTLTLYIINVIIFNLNHKRRRKEIHSMYDDCIPFEYGRIDGTIVSEEEFYSEHSDVVLTPAQKERLKQNLEVQCILALKEFGNKEYIVHKRFCKTFIYEDEETKELYLKPLEIEVGVFFRKIAPILFIYDLRMVS